LKSLPSNTFCILAKKKALLITSQERRKIMRLNIIKSNVDQAPSRINFPKTVQSRRFRPVSSMVAIYSPFCTRTEGRQSIFVAFVTKLLDD
jgi:hypothetical protein